jgi:hypothetical protein
MKQMKSWKTRTMIIGLIAGALTGLAAAQIVIERAERERVVPSISPGDGVKLGLGVLGLMRLISDLGDDQ